VYQPTYVDKRIGESKSELGMGHAVLYGSDIHAAAELYVRTLGFGVSDYVVSPNGNPLGVFMHCNPRHHSLALFQVPGAKRKIQHVMFETNSLDDVGTSYDLCLGREITATSLGQHGNDRSFSFYFRKSVPMVLRVWQAAENDRSAELDNRAICDRAGCGLETCGPRENAVGDRTSVTSPLNWDQLTPTCRHAARKKDTVFVT
jgi:catechol 2,3-dioxygenase-like lactoylglutathione lyase family enzyme